jgi:tetratricopeptide (TPR) repeat protein
MIKAKQVLLRPHGRSKTRGSVVVESEAPPPSAILQRRSTRLGLLALFLVSFAVYGATCGRTVTGEDSGELITAAYTTGVAHPPGYPTWTLLAKAATLIPVGEVAFRVALLSAFFGALTVTAIAAILLLLSQAWLPAIASSLAFGFLRDQWSQATIAEVYTLNTFFLALCTLLLLLWGERKSWRLFFLFAFTYGLSLTNHHLMLGAAPPFLIFILIKGWRLLRKWPQILIGVACFSAGLLPYAYLPIAASRNAPVNWGNPTTRQALVDHVTRRQYLDAETPPDRSWERFSDQLAVMGRAFVEQGATPLLLLGLLTLLFLAKQRFMTFLVLFGVAVVSSIGFILQTNVSVDFESAYASRLFHVPAWMMITIAAGLGIAEVLKRVPRRSSLALGSLAVVLAITPPAVANFTGSDYSEYRIVANHARRLLVSLPGNAIVFPSSDHNTFPLLYLRFVEGLRPDVTIADKYGYIDPEIVAGSPCAAGVHPKTLRSRPFREAIEGWVIETSARPVFFSNKGRAPAGCELVSEGLWYRARKQGTSVEDLQRADDAAWAAVEATPIADPPSPYDYSARMVLSDLAFAKARRFAALGRTDEAVAECRKASEHVPESKEVQNNLGSLLAESGRFDGALEFFRKAVELDPSYTTGTRNLATSLRASGKSSEAKATYLKLLDLCPLDPGANRGLASIAKTQGEWATAAVHLEEAAKVERDPVAFRDAGLIRLLELRDLKRAKELLRASLALDPNQPDIREVEEQIKPVGKSDEANGDEAASAEKRRADPDDHSKHDCRALGCDARKSAQQLAGLAGNPTPTPPNPLSSVMPKTGVPQGPAVAPKISQPRLPTRKAPQ